MSSDRARPVPRLRPPPPSFVSADIFFVDAVPDSAGGNPKGRRVDVLTLDDALAAGFPTVVAPVTSQIPPVPGPDDVVLPFRNPPGTRHPVHRPDPAGRDRRHLAGRGRSGRDRGVLGLRASTGHGRRPRQDRGGRPSPRRMALSRPAVARGHLYSSDANRPPAARDRPNPPARRRAKTRNGHPATGPLQTGPLQTPIFRADECRVSGPLCRCLGPLCRCLGPLCQVLFGSMPNRFYQLAASRRQTWCAQCKGV